MTRLVRFPLVVLLSSALASTGLCASLSAGAAPSCPVADVPSQGGCDQEPGDETCPAAPAHPTCRMCEDAVAFFVKEKSAGDDAPSATFTLAPTLAPRPLSPPPQTSGTPLSSLSASPPIHLLNVTFRN